MADLAEIEEARHQHELEIVSLLGDMAELRAELREVREDLRGGITEAKLATSLTTSLKASLQSLEAELAHRRSELDRLRRESLLLNPSAEPTIEGVTRGFLGQHPATPETRLRAIALLDQFDRPKTDTVSIADFDQAWDTADWADPD